MTTARVATGTLDTEACYRAVKGRDRRFDGVFYTAVRTTGIYCRPSCPAITPKRANVSFFRTAAGAQGAGYRACRRCLPDATPGSPEWDVAADVASRAMRLVADGVVERDGRRRAGPAPRLLHPPAQPRRHPGVRRRPAGARPLASCPDRPHPDRDHRPLLRRHRVRGRLRQHPPVQRHGPRGVRRDADRSPLEARPPAGRHLRHDPHPHRRARAVRGRGAPPVPGPARGARPRGLRRRTGTSGRSGCRTARAWSGSRSGRTARTARWSARSRSPTPATSPRRPSARGGCSTPTATRRPSTRRWPRTRSSRRWWPPRRASVSPGSSTGPRWRCRPCSGSR